MKHRKNLIAKIVAGIALSAIIVSIVGTGILFIYQLYFQPTANSNQTINQEQLDAYLKSLESQSGSELSASWELLQEEIIPELQWDEK